MIIATTFATVAVFGTNVFAAEPATPADGIVHKIQSTEIAVSATSSATTQALPNLSGFSVLSDTQSQINAQQLPQTIYVGGQVQHVQGIAYDGKAGCMYMSFTSRFVKTDLNGNILASIDRIQGHLGAMTFDPVGRRCMLLWNVRMMKSGRGLPRLSMLLWSPHQFSI